ncbi:hypothetical protein [Petroclostridium sp. X23]|nr:hypothetical protein [Petroclostridium sp. X23]WHH56933.1 hypothetical protein QKW49_13850 [Petroclostridium sp. X23]
MMNNEDGDIAVLSFGEAIAPSSCFGEFDFKDWAKETCLCLQSGLKE